MDVLFIQQRHKIKKIFKKKIFFYKSEKSVGRVPVLLPLVSKFTFDDELFPKIVSHNTFISWKILSGEEYFETSSPNNPANFGNTNIDKTITQRPIKAYLIELIAGLILSSFHPDKISKTPPHKIYIIENIPANKTISDIASNIKSPKSILEVNNVPVWEEAYAISKNIWK